MPLARSNTARSRSRSPAPPPASSSHPPHTFLPPSHYAAAGGLTLPDRVKSMRHDSEYEVDSLPQDSFIQVPLLAQASISDSSMANEHHAESRLNLSGKEKTALDRTRKNRESQLANLPFVEAQLLPSLRDTIDRMTRPPSRVVSKAGSSTPAFRSPAFTLCHDSDHEIPSPHTPSQSHTRSTLLNSTFSPTPEASNFFGESSTPKVTHSTPKSALKSALKSPTPKLSSSKTDLPDTVPSSSMGGTALKSVRSLLRRKSSTPSPADCTVSGKKASKENEPAESFSVIRPNGTRSRSRTDPGLLPAPQELVRNVAPVTPQPASQALSSRAYGSHIPRLRGKYAANPKLHRSRFTDESDFEYRYEMEGRDRRKLTVANAEVIASASSSESEVESVRSDFAEGPSASTRSKDQAVIGLGFRYGVPAEDFQMHGGFEQDTSIHRPNGNYGNDKRFSLTSYPSAASVYTDEESEQEVPMGRDISRQSRDLMDEISSRRRAALLGLVQGLDLQTANAKKVLGGAEESEYSGEEGLAVSGSGATGVDCHHDSMSRRESYDESESEYEFEEDKIEGTVPGLTGRVPRPSRASTPKVTIQDEDGKTANASSKSSAKHVSSSFSNLLPSRVDFGEQWSSPTSHQSSYAKVTKPIPSVIKRKSFLEERHLTPTSSPRVASPSISIPSPTAVSADKRDSYGYESVLIAKRSREAAVRNRQAFGIPPSESVEMYRSNETPVEDSPIAHTDSIASGVHVESWDHDGGNELSVGAETLFRTLSGGEQAYERRRSYLRSGQPASSTSNDGEDRSKERRQSRYRSRTPVQRRLSEQGHDGENLGGRFAPDARTWRASMDATSYHAFLDQHGEVEMQRQEIIWELRESEKGFFQRLTSIVHLFMVPLRIQGSKTWIAGVPLEIAKTLDWLEDIINMHEKIQDALLLAQTADNPIAEQVADRLRVFVPRFEIYQPYLVKVDGVVEMLERLVQDRSSEFGEFVRLQEKTSRSQGSLASLLVEPVDRLSLYPDIFQKLLDVTPKAHQDRLSTLILVHSTSMLVKTLKEVKAREEDYEFIKDMSKRITGLIPLAETHLSRRDRRLLCRGQLLQVDKMKSSNNQDSLTMSTRFNRASRLVEAINEVDFRRSRSDSVKSNSSSDTAVSAEVMMPLPLLPVEVLVFSDLILLATAQHGREIQEKGSNRWILCEDIGISRVLDVSEEENKHYPDSPLIKLDVLSTEFDLDQDTRNGNASRRIKTIFFSLPHKSTSNQLPTRQAWLSSLRRSCQATIRAFSDPRLPHDGVVDGPNRLLEQDKKRILDSILASGLPLPKSPSLQLGDIHSGKVNDSVQMEREERGWWSLRFQQVLQELLHEDRVTTYAA